MTDETTTRSEVDFNIHGEEYRQQRTVAEEKLRSESPVAWTEHYGGHWIISSHATVGQVLRDPSSFSAEKWRGQDGEWKGGITIPTSVSYRALPNEADPPMWDYYRKSVAQTFSPQNVQTLRPKIEEYATEVIDHMIEDGKADFVMQVGSPVTALITLDVVGLPLEDWRFYAERIHQTFTGQPGDGSSEAGVAGIQSRLEQTVADRKANPQNLGLLDELLTKEIDGRPIDEEEVKDLIYDILVGGFDTTAGLLAGTLKYLADKPEIKQRLIEDDDFLRTATEEFLRWVSPAVGLAKSAAKDLKVGGQSISKGDPMWFMYRSANWDSDQFENPEVPDLERSPNPHYAFGIGIHRCLGSNLARAVFQIVLRQFLQRVPDYKVAEDELELYAFGATNAGFATFPITYTPGEKVRETPLFETL